jgi:uncharacterized membrane protein
MSPSAAEVTAPGRRRLARSLAAILGVFYLVFGVWAFFWPQSFYEAVASFAPFNLHFLHDLGAFQIGLGAVLLLALRWHDALSATLGGVAAGSVMHAVSHVVDRDLGGRPSDPFAVAFIAVLAVVATIAARSWRGG